MGGLVREVWSDCCLLSNYDLRGRLCLEWNDVFFLEWGFQRRGQTSDIFGCAELRWSVGRSSYDGVVLSFFFSHWFCGLVFWGGAWLGSLFFFLLLMLVDTFVVVWDGRWIALGAPTFLHYRRTESKEDTSISKLLEFQLRFDDDVFRKEGLSLCNFGTVRVRGVPPNNWRFSRKTCVCRLFFHSIFIFGYHYLVQRG